MIAGAILSAARAQGVSKTRPYVPGLRERSRCRLAITAWNRSKSVVGSSASEGCADENTIVPPDASMAGATLGVHHSAPEEPLMRATQRVARSNAYTSGRRFVSLPGRGHPGPDPRFDARDWYATTSPSSESAGLRLPALADWPFDVTLTSVVVRAETSKMYTSRSLFRSLGSRAASDSNATYRPSALSAGEALAPLLCAAHTSADKHSDGVAHVPDVHVGDTVRIRGREPGGRDEGHDCTVAAHTGRVTGAHRRLCAAGVDTDPRNLRAVELPRIDIGLPPVGIGFRHEIRGIRGKHDHTAVATHCRLAGPSVWSCAAGAHERPHDSALAVSNDDTSARGATRRQIRCDGLECENSSVCTERGGLAVALRGRAITADALLRDFPGRSIEHVDVLTAGAPR